MTLAKRRLLLASFILIFAFCGPLLVLYASGYRYNTRLRKIEQVGVLSLSTKQEGATAIIDGKPYRIKRDLLLSALRPRDYEIVVTKPGYHPWAKQLPIAEGRTTFARDIILFADETPQPSELFANPLALLAESDQYVLYQGNDTIVLYRTADGAILEAALPHGSNLVDQAVLAREHRAIFRQMNAWYMVDIGQQPLRISELPAPEGTTSIQSSDGTLYALTDTSIFEWDGEQFNPLLNAEEPQTVYVTGKTLWMISAEATHKRSFLYEISNPNVRPRFHTSLPYSDKWSIADIAGTLLTLHDGANQGLVLVDARINPPALVTLDGVFDWHWSKDHRALLTASANELAIYHVDNGAKQELIARQTEPIIDVQWAANESWVIYTTAAGVYAAERDGRDKRNIIALTEGKAKAHILSVTPSWLMFSSQQGNSFVFWNLPLETP